MEEWTLIDSINQLEEQGIKCEDMVVLYNTYNFQEIIDFAPEFITNITNTYDIKTDLIDVNNDVIFYVVQKEEYEEIKKHGYVTQSDKYKVATIKFK